MNRLGAAMTRTLTLTAAAAALAVTGIAADAPPAQAAPGAGIEVVCQAKIVDRWWGTAWCTGGSYRVMLLCEENSGGLYVTYGPWTSGGGVSAARCHEYATAYRALAEHR